MNKIDSDTAGSKREKCDEIPNEMKRMLIKTCWKKDFIEKNTQPGDAVGATKCYQSMQSERQRARRTPLLVVQGCECSHILMTVNQELLSNTIHVQEQKGAITQTLFGPPRDIDKTTLQTL